MYLRRPAFKLQICSSVILARGEQYFNDAGSYIGIKHFFSVIKMAVLNSRIFSIYQADFSYKLN